jgi:AAA15 family ATPase/GTPase
MLIQFTVGNFLSFKDKTTVSMVASKYRDHKEHVFKALSNIKLLKCSAIYGANASGKSNLIKAMNFMKRFVLFSTKGSIESPINVKIFKLAVEMDNKPSFFEIVFIIDKIIYRYGFEATISKILGEWLYFSRADKEYLLFERKSNKFNINRNTFKEGLNLENKTRNNSLFLSVVAEFNGIISNKIIEWLHNFNVITGLNDYSLFTAKFLESDDMKYNIINLLKTADLFIENIKKQEKLIEKNSLPSLPINKNVELLPDGNFKLVDFLTFHKKYKNGKVIGETLMNMDSEESEGTKKYFSLSGPILDTLMNGKILVADEFDARLHPLLLINLIQLFNSEINNKNAQLIFVIY